MAKAIEIAKYLVSLSDEDAGDTVSNLKVQKLLYYAQGFALVILGKPLFDEDIEAWNHGPVVASVYHELKSFGSGGVKFDETDTEQDCPIGPEEQQLLNDVYDAYGQFSAWKLRDMTHTEAPWVETSQGCFISHSKLIKHFKKLVDE